MNAAAKPDELARVQRELQERMRRFKMNASRMSRYADTVETKLLAMCVAAAATGVIGDDLVVDALDLVASDGTTEQARFCAREELMRHARKARTR